jgi:hypothetical protein
MVKNQQNLTIYEIPTSLPRYLFRLKITASPDTNQAIDSDTITPVVNVSFWIRSSIYSIVRIPSFYLAFYLDIYKSVSDHYN